MKERFLKTGLEKFEEHEVMELLLYYCVPRQDVNALSHRLVDRFGSVLQVVQAPERELMKVEGVGKGITTFLQLLNETNRYLNISEGKYGKQMCSVSDYGKYLVNFFVGIPNEVVYLLCMDAKAQVICCQIVAEGSVTSANISIRKLLDLAIGSNASSVVLAHNHPGGFAVPSGEDKITTMRVAKALYLADVELVDHVIVAGKDYISMRASGLYNPYEICIDD